MNESQRMNDKRWRKWWRNEFSSAFDNVENLAEVHPYNRSSSGRAHPEKCIED